MTFSGFPVAALDFYDDLELNNSKEFWASNKKVYDQSVLAPMKALTAALADEFGNAKVFRPYRDVRFAKDKSPYKTHQGAYVPTGPATGWYVQLSAAGVMVGAGFYDASSARLAALRAAIDDDDTGPELDQLLARLTKRGWEVGGERLKTAPRGYDVSHPRIELLRHKSLSLSKSYGFGKEIGSPKLLDRVRSDWREAKPLVDWLGSVAE